jgi:hypothetical protein
MPDAPGRREDVSMASWFSVKDRREAPAAEVCDRCGARARVVVLLLSGRRLYLCWHHVRQHEEALRRAESEFQDLSN